MGEAQGVRILVRPLTRSEPPHHHAHYVLKIHQNICVINLEKQLDWLDKISDYVTIAILL